MTGGSGFRCCGFQRWIPRPGYSQLIHAAMDDWRLLIEKWSAGIGSVWHFDFGGLGMGWDLAAGRERAGIHGSWGGKSRGSQNRDPRYGSSVIAGRQVGDFDGFGEIGSVW